MMLGTQPADGIDGTGRDIEEKRRAKAAERAPLGHRLERVDGLGGLDLDGALQTSSSVHAEEHHVWIHRDLTDGHRCVLLRAWIDGDVVLSLVAALQDSNDAIVLELLADRAHEDRTHWASGRERKLDNIARTSAQL